MRRAAALALLVVAPLAAAESPHSMDGIGRISVQGGWRYVPNGYFAGKADAAGSPFLAPSPGGPAVVASFGYGTSEWLEVAIDAFGAYETFELAGNSPFNAWTYGALVGVRAWAIDRPFRGLMPWVGLQLGPALATISSPSMPGAERLLGGLSASGGVVYRWTDEWGLSAELRWLQARVPVGDIGGANAGGVFFTLGVTHFAATTGGTLDLKPPSI